MIRQVDADRLTTARAIIATTLSAWARNDVALRQVYANFSTADGRAEELEALACLVLALTGRSENDSHGQTV